MSGGADVPQGPGWWLASDGRYYPPATPVPATGSTTAKGCLIATLVVVASLIVFGVIGALSGGGESERIARPDRSDEPQVDWQNHVSTLRQELLASSCRELQERFDAADQMNDVQRRRTGDGNADLMGWIDDRMRTKGCYG